MDFPFQNCSFQEIEDFNSINFEIIPNSVNSTPMDDTFIAPFVQCPIDICLEAVLFGKITKEDLVIDLGCGDGRILHICSQFNPIGMIGVELDPELAKYASEKYPKVQILHMDMFKVDLIKLNVTFIVLYLLPNGLFRLINQLTEWFNDKNQIKRIVTINYEIPGIKHQSHKEINKKYNLYLYQTIEKI